jgi:hypothetical protein
VQHHALNHTFCACAIPLSVRVSRNVHAVVFNPLTHNFQSLVLHCIVLLHDARSGKNQRPAANALRLVGSVSQ